MIIYQNNLTNISKEQLTGFFVGWRKPLSADEHLAILENSQYITIAIDNITNKVVGFINSLSDKTQFAFIPLLEVLPEYQNQGIGSKLVNMMLEQLHHITNIDLTCDKELQPFYKKLGMFESHGMIMRKFL